MIKVIIIDDDKMIQHLHSLYVNKTESFEVMRSFENALDALEFLKKNPSLIDLIILDYYMPKMDGYEFISRLREEDIYTDVIAVTAANEIDTIKKFNSYGLFDYLIKPFDEERLISSLKNFKKYTYMIRANDELTQKDLDSLINNEVKDIKELPKGIQEKTLMKILDEIESIDDEEIDIDYLIKKCQLSIVSIRKYMDFLEENGKVKIELYFGKIGRPKHRYFKT